MSPTTSATRFQPAGPKHEAFTQWCKDRNIKIRTISPARIPGRGLGMIAQRRVEAGEELINVPTAALLTERSVPESFREKHGGISVHGLLASFLAFGGADVEPYAPWRATWPSFVDFQTCMPMLWPESLRNRLDGDKDDSEKKCPLMPLAIESSNGLAGLLSKQEKSVERDWAVVERVFPGADKDTYLYYWLIVNTRTFYYELPGLSGKRAKEDRMVMCPFVDYFNHADQGCHVTFDDDGYSVVADKSYGAVQRASICSMHVDKDAGEEIYVSYGSHSNDFLLVEYGFILENNKWDHLPIDDLVISNVLCHKPQRDKLEREGYLGNYTLTVEGVCHRTQVAIRTLTLNSRDWKRYLKGFSVSEEACDELQVGVIIEKHILQVYQEAAEKALQALGNMDDESVKHQTQTLVSRWTQIKSMIEQARHE